MQKGTEANKIAGWGWVVERRVKDSSSLRKSIVLSQGAWSKLSYIPQNFIPALSFSLDRHTHKCLAIRGIWQQGKRVLHKHTPFYRHLSFLSALFLFVCYSLSF
jgi:hypothetical protein